MSRDGRMLCHDELAANRHDSDACWARLDIECSLKWSYQFWSTRVQILVGLEARDLQELKKEKDAVHMCGVI